VEVVEGLHCEIISCDARDVAWLRLAAAAESSARRRRRNGDAENARHETAGHENAAPDCKGGKCET